MSQKILNQSPPLTHLDLYMLFNDVGTALLQQGEGILHALAYTTRPTLLSLNLGYNYPLWMVGEARFNLLLNVLQQQYNLEDLNLRWSEFSALQTE